MYKKIIQIYNLQIDTRIMNYKAFKTALSIIITLVIKNLLFKKQFLLFIVSTFKVLKIYSRDKSPNLTSGKVNTDTDIDNSFTK